MRKSVFVALFVCVSAVVFAQPSHYSVSLLGGAVIPVNGSPYDVKSPLLGVDFSAYWKMRGEEWAYIWRNPSFGIRANYSTIFNSVAGDRFELAGFMEGPVVEWKGGGIDWVYSVGFSAYTNPYMRTHDPENSYIGSYLNCLIDLGFLWKFPVKDQEMFLAAKLVHSSNGYLSKPNHGLNFLQAELGYRWRNHTHACDTATTSSRLFRPYRPERPHRFFVSFAPGAVQSRNDDVDYRKLYFAYTTNVGYRYCINSAFAFGGNVDLMYNYAHRALAPNDVPLYVGASAFWDNTWGPITMRIGLGHYLDYYWQNWEQYYERVGLFYRFGSQRNYYAGVAMKVHYDHVDYIEWTFGFEF